jgi:NACalpha-BTF3-like transcription factor
MAVIVIFVLEGLRKISANPPCKAVVTRFGKRTDKIKDEGWRFFPFYPFWYGYILVDMTKKNKDFETEEVRTPDLAQLAIPISITFTPDKNRLVEYLNCGGEAGVWKILEDVINEKVRVWAMAVDEGPATAEEALAAAEDAVAILIKAVAGEDLPVIPSPFPTTSLLKALNQPPKSPGENEKKFGENWGKIKEWHDKLSDGERATFDKALKDRREIIAKIRQSNGMIEAPSLAIILNRLNVGKIRALGKYAEAADLEAKERKERSAEVLEIQHVADTIQKLMKQLGITTEQAIEILQTERGKVAKNISESKWNIAPETREMIEKITSDVLTKFLKKIRKGGESNG